MNKRVNILIILSFIIYILALCVLLFFGNRGQWNSMSIWEYAAMHMNLVPFKTIDSYVKALVRGNMNFNIWVANLLGNLVLFFPMGIYIPLFFDKISSVGHCLLRLAPILFMVELIQLLTQRGSFDIDDLILNLIGAVLGFLLFKEVRYVYNGRIKSSGC